MTTQPNRGFQLVGEEDEPSPQPQPQPQLHENLTRLLILSLTALAQRTVVALARLFALLTVGSAFWLWMLTPDPSVYQLVQLGMYAAFVLVINFIVLTRRL